MPEPDAETLRPLELVANLPWAPTEGFIAKLGCGHLIQLAEIPRGYQQTEVRLHCPRCHAEIRAKAWEAERRAGVASHVALLALLAPLRRAGEAVAAAQLLAQLTKSAGAAEQRVLQVVLADLEDAARHVNNATRALQGAPEKEHV